jgi:predicted glycosyltransferase
MIYSQDGLGLGHMRRTGSIASQLLEEYPNACVLTLHDSPLGTFFDLSQNQDYLKLPSIVKIGPGNWEAVKLPIEFDEVLGLRRDLIRAAALRFRPDILLVDHMPQGAMGELIPALEALHSEGRTSIVLGLRDILDSPEVIRRRWRIEGGLAAIERYYDRVLVYGSRHIFDLAQEYGLSKSVAAKLHYCGYVCTAAGPRYTTRIRNDYRSGTQNGGRLLVAMAGGGFDGYRAMRATVDAIPDLQRKAGFRAIIITGPFMPLEQRRDLQARAAGLPVQVRMTVSDSLSYIHAADVVVAMAGYNTTTEILRASTPAVLIPRAGPSAEQRMRVGCFRERGWIHSVEPEAATGRTVGAAVLKVMRQRSKVRHPLPDLGGLGAVVEQLVALLPEDARLRDALVPDRA